MFSFKAGAQHSPQPLKIQSTVERRPVLKTAKYFSLYFSHNIFLKSTFSLAELWGSIHLLRRSFVFHGNAAHPPTGFGMGSPPPPPPRGQSHEGGFRYVKIILNNDRSGWQLFHLRQGVTKRCRLSWLTNSALVWAQMRREGGCCGVYPINTAVH
jgi:hypothetical protein